MSELMSQSRYIIDLLLLLIYLHLNFEKFGVYLSYRDISLDISLSMAFN